MRKIMKKMISMLIGVVGIGCITSMQVSAADSDFVPQVLRENEFKDVNYYDGTLWEYFDFMYIGDTKGSRIYEDEHQAGPNGAGETLSISQSKSFSVTYSGAITVSSANKFASQFGVQVGTQKGLSVTRTSRALNNNEKVTGYLVPIYRTYTVYEQEISYTLKNGVYTRYEPTGKRRQGTVKIPKTLDVEFVYSY